MMKRILFFISLSFIRTGQAAQCSKVLVQAYTYARSMFESAQSRLNKDFHALVDADYIFVAQDIVRLGVQVTAKDNKGRTPLMKAAEKNNFDFLMFLLVKGAAATVHDLYAIDAAGKTVFEYMKQHSKCARELKRRHDALVFSWIP